MRKSILNLCSVLVLATLSACGGSGGSSPGTIATPTSTPTPSAATTTPITETNFSATADFVGKITQMLAPKTNYFLKVTEVTTRAVLSAKINVPLLPGTNLNVSKNCAKGGSFSVTGTLLREHVLDVGSVLRVTANHCVENNGDARDGKITITITSNDGKAGAVVYDNFMVSTPSTTVGHLPTLALINGDAKMPFIDFFTIGFGGLTAIDHVVTGSKLEVKVTSNGVVTSDTNLTNYNISHVIESRGGFDQTSVNGDMSVSFNSNNGTGKPIMQEMMNLTVATTTAFTGIAGSATITDGTSVIKATSILPIGTIQIDFFAKKGGPVTKTAITTTLGFTNL